MKEAVVGKKDQILMQLVHYFITVENYTPIVVKGVKNEVWLENLDAPYRIIRINTNYIHNNEQFDFDIFKIRSIVKQVKKKTLSFKVKTLNILVDVGTNVDKRDADKIDCVFIDSSKSLKREKKINELYPQLKYNLVDTSDNVDFIINVTNDINEKTEKENKEFENVFKRKDFNLTYILIGINIFVFALCWLLYFINGTNLFDTLILSKYYVANGQIYRLITSAFLHQSVFHLLFNMYALYIIGTQVETYMGKGRYLFVYLASAICSSLLSCVVNTGFSLGASGAIFGLMGALLYFGYHYRLYLDNVLKTEIIPLIAVNLLIGFLLPNIDNAAHIGGLVGGLFSSMAIGIKNKGEKADHINGTICLIILVCALSYILFCL